MGLRPPSGSSAYTRVMSSIGLVAIQNNAQALVFSVVTIPRSVRRQRVGTILDRRVKAMDDILVLAGSFGTTRNAKSALALGVGSNALMTNCVLSTDWFHAAETARPSLVGTTLSIITWKSHEKEKRRASGRETVKDTHKIVQVLLAVTSMLDATDTS